MARLPLPPAETINLRSLAELARGGMGSIELSRADGGRRDGQLFAVKRLHERFAKDPQFVAMFLDEAWMTAAMKSPNVVQVAAWGTDDRGMFLAVELVEGVSLHGLLRATLQRDDPFSERTVTFLCAEICAGLAAAHDLRGTDGSSLGLVHRDLTLGNVLVSFKGEVKIADFGIAKARARITHTEDGMLKGKPGYMAPEQARGKDLDHRADLFSFGVIMFELLAGRRPWISESAIELMLEAAQEPPPDLASLRRGVDRTLVTIVNKCLEKEPDKRYRSALEIKRLIDEWRAGRGFVGGERDSLARFVQRNCEPQVEWFKRAIAGDFSRGPATTFKELEERLSGEPSAKMLPRRSRPSAPSTPAPSEGRPNEGRPSEGRPSEGKPSEGKPRDSAPPSPPVTAPNAKGAGARFSFVARWASTQPLKGEEGGPTPTSIPRAVLPSRAEEPQPAQPAQPARAPQPTLVAQVAQPAPPERAAQPAQPAQPAPPAQPPPPAQPAARRPPTTGMKAPQATLKSREVIPDLMRAIGAAPVANLRPAGRRPPTVKVTGLTTKLIEEAARVDSKEGRPDSMADTAPATPRDVSVGTFTPVPPLEPAPATPRDGSTKAEDPAPGTPSDGASSLGSIPTPPLPPPPPVPQMDVSAAARTEQVQAAPAGEAGAGLEDASTQGRAVKAAEDEIDLGPQPTMKSPPITASTAPPPQPVIDIQVSLPAPLPPQPPKPPPSERRGAKRRNSAGRTRISTAMAKHGSAKPTKPAKGKIAAPTALLAVIALFVGAILAWLLRSRM